jgi:ABC-type lipoprotein release transport system permease subunit
LFYKLGIRNIWRNKRRSLLSGLAMGIGLAALIFIDGFFLGLFGNMVSNVTDSYLGHGQIHHKEFLQTMEVSKTISQSEKTLLKLDNNLQVEAAAPRVISIGMISSAEDSQNIMIVGISPDREKKISQIYSRMDKGNFIASEQDILIGNKLMEKLGVSVGERIVVTATQKGTNDLAQELFRVAGSYLMGSKEMDEQMAFIHIKKAQSMLGLKSEYHELAFRFQDRKIMEDNNLFWKEYTQGTNEALSWRKLAPGIDTFMELNQFGKGIISFILLLLVSLGIMNTLFMSLYERLFEFGVLRALGTRSTKLVLMILSEAGALSIISIILGIMIALLVGGFVSIYGIDYGGIEIAGVTLRDKIYFVFSIHQFTYYPLLIFCFTILISLYPGIHVTKITLAKAMKKSL